MPLDVLLTVEEAAARLKSSKHTLNRWRVTGEGPPFVKYGPKLVRYSTASLDEWEKRRARTSTTQPRHQERDPDRLQSADQFNGDGSTPKSSQQSLHSGDVE